MRKTIKTTIFPCFSENSCAVRMRHSPLYLPNVKSDSLVRNAQSKPQFFPISPYISFIPCFQKIIVQLECATAPFRTDRQKDRQTDT